MRFKKDPSRRVRYEWVYWCVHHSRPQNAPSDPIIPFPTGRVRFLASPGSELPGYLHSVPSGQRAFRRLVYKIDSTSPATFENEDGDEDEYEGLAYLTPPTMKPSASSVARTLVIWSPWISMVRSFTVPPVLHADRNFFATFSICESGRWVAKS